MNLESVSELFELKVHLKLVLAQYWLLLVKLVLSDVTLEGGLNQTSIPGVSVFHDSQQIFLGLFRTLFDAHLLKVICN